MAVQTQIQARRGTAATWTSTNPTLAAGETGYETDTGKFKIGNGSTAWASLAYATNGAAVSPLTTKGDLYTYSTGDARLAVGANGETLVADSSTSTGLRWQGDYAAGKNKIINGDFNIFQRGTSTTIGVGAYWADRFAMNMVAAVPTGTASRQTFTPGAAPVAGYEGNYFGRVNITAHNNCTQYYIYQKIENVTTFAGQSVTLSVFLKADAATAIGVYLVQNFGSGGSGAVSTTMDAAKSITDGFVRYTFTATVPSISGKTIGTGSSLELRFVIPNSGSYVRVGTYDFWGVQLEAGSVATAFQTATGTIQGELAACQRYLPAISGAIGNDTFQGYAFSTTGSQVFVKFPTTARKNPTGITVSSASHFLLGNTGFSQSAPTAITWNSGGVDYANFNVTTTAGSPTLAQNNPVYFRTDNSAALILFTGCEL